MLICASAVRGAFGEYDGAYHRDPAQYERDRRREGRLRALGWEPFSYSVESVLREPVRILRDADEALGRAHRPQRIKAFYDPLNGSSYTKLGAAQLRARLAVSLSSARLNSRNGKPVPRCQMHPAVERSRR